MACAVLRKVELERVGVHHRRARLQRMLCVGPGRSDRSVQGSKLICDSPWLVSLDTDDLGTFGLR